MVERIQNEELAANAGSPNSADMLLAQAELVASEASAPATLGAVVETQRFVVEVGEGSILRLPISASIDQPRVNGTDLEFVQPDGTVIVVPEGAIQGLTIFIGNVEIPPQTVAVLFEANGIEAAAGPEGGNTGRGSGGNFEVPVGGIGDGLEYGGLLDPTELAFGDLKQEELFLSNDRPRFGGSGLFEARLSEEGLASGNRDDAGASDTTDRVIFTGNLGAFDPNGDPLTFSFGAPAAGLTSNGTAITWTGVGTSVLIGSANGAPVVIATVTGSSGDYSVTLLGAVDHPDGVTEDELAINFTVIANDGRGLTETATIRVIIEDDSPLAGLKGETLQLDEDGLKNSVGNTDSDGDNAGQAISGTGALSIRWGSDNGDKGADVFVDGIYAQDNPAAGGRAVYFTDDVVQVTGHDGAALSSNGVKVIFTLDPTGTKIFGHAGNTLVIEVSLSDDNTGRYAVKLYGNLDHAPNTGDEVGGIELLRVASNEVSGIENDIELTFNFTARDSDGDTSQSTFTVVIDDDMPVVSVAAVNGASVTHDESAWPQNIVWNFFNPGDRNDNDTGVIASVLKVSQLFEDVSDKGNDADVPSAAKLFFQGAIGYAQSSQALVSATVNFGADGKAAVDGLVYSLKLGNAPSGLFTTEGQPITLDMEDGIIVGRIEGGTAAIAIHIDPETGKVTIAQWLSLRHDNATDHDDAKLLTAGSVLVEVTATDGDGDSHAASADISGQIRFEDDGPAVSRFEARGNARLVLDESVGADGSTQNEGGRANNDETFAGAADGAIGFARLSGSSLFQQTIDGGSDGLKSSVYSLVLGGAQNGKIYSGLTDTDSNEKIILKQVGSDIEGVTESGAKVFTISVGVDGSVTVNQFRAIKHDDSRDHDENGSKAEAIAGGKLSLQVTVTDGDNDTDSASFDLGKLIRFEDDGPALSLVAFDPLHNGLFADGFNVHNMWGNGSGTATGTSGGWTISESVGGGGGPVELQRVGSGYLGMHSSTNGFMVDLNASNKNIAISQVIEDLAPNGTYRLTFEAGSTGGAGDSVEVWFDGVKITTINSSQPGVMNTYSFDIKLGAAGSDGSKLLEFKEVGSVLDNHGTYLANVSISNQIIIDETDGNDLGSDDIALLAIFDGVTNQGSDSDMAEPEYAVGRAPVVSFTADFGSDGKGASVYALSVTSGATTGLRTTEGQAISLLLEEGGKYVVGRFDSNGDNVVNADDKAAFAIHIDPATGIVSVAQYVSLEHPNTASHDEGISLALGSLAVTVKVTDGDGDSATKSADISQHIRFEDDGPAITGVISNQFGAELILNGSFESAGNVPGGWQLFTSTEGWTSNGGVPFEIQSNGAGGQSGANGTNNLVELDSDQDSGFNDTNATIAQTIQTVAGQTYSLTFHYAARPGAAAGNGMIAKVGSDIVFTLGNDAEKGSGWQQHTITFVATGASTTISFTGTGTPDELGILLDEVSVRAVLALDDDSQLFGVPGGPGDGLSGNVLTGKINIDAGSDGLARIAFDQGTLAGVKAIWVDEVTNVPHQVAVNTVWTQNANDAGGTLTATMASGGTTRPVFTLVVNADGTFKITMQAPIAHPLTSGEGSVGSFEDNVELKLGFKVTDGDGDTASSNITITIDDDTPVASNEPVVSLKELATETGQLDFQTGADGGKVTHINATLLVFGNDGWSQEIPTDHGKIKVTATGQYSFTALDNVATGSVVDALTYTVTDGDGDQATAALSFEVGNRYTAPTGGKSDSVILDEDNLAVVGTSPDELALTQTVSLGFTAGTEALNSFKFDISDLNLDGDAISDAGVISWTGNGTGVVIGSVGGQEVIKLTLEASTIAVGQTGNVTVKAQLLGAFDNDLADNIQSQLDLGAIKVIASDGTTEVTGTVAITVTDDIPEPTADAYEVQAGESRAGLDLKLLIDVSQSMTLTVGNTGKSRLTLAKEALQQLVDNPDVENVQFVLFDRAATTSPWMTAAAAKIYITGIMSGSGTNYDAALTAAQNSGFLDSGNDRYVFFVSDGEPSLPSGSLGTNAAEEQAWINYLTTAGVKESFAVGFGGLSQTNQNNIEPIAWQPGETHTTSPAAPDSNVIIVSDSGLVNLAGYLQAQITPVDGNVLGNDKLGADSFGHIASVTVGGVTYTYDPATGMIKIPADATAVALGAQLTVRTAAGGEFKFFFADSAGREAGDWLYQPPVNTPATFVESISYTVVDGDGDGTSSALNITVRPDNLPSVTLPGAGDLQPAVSEAGLPARGTESAGSNESASSETTSGTLAFTSLDGVKSILLGGHNLTTTDQTFADATGSLTARYSFDAATGQGSITYKYTLIDNTSGANTSATFPVVVTDNDGDKSAAGNLVIKIVDDVPNAGNGFAGQVVVGAGQDFNIAFVLDFSGSISDQDFVRQRTAVLAAAKAIFEGTSGDVAITAIPFANGAYTMSGSPYSDYTAFKTAYEAINSNGNRGPNNSFTSGTNYNAALLRVMAEFDPVDGEINRVFFLSDGLPTAGTQGGAPFQNSTNASWTAFVNNPAYDLDVTSIGIGSGIQNGPLQAVDVDGAGAPILLTDFGALVTQLVNIVSSGDITGNVLFGQDGANGGGDDTVFGADGGRIQSIVVNGVTYTWNGKTGAASVIDPSQGNDLIGTAQLSGIATGSGNKLTFNFETGAWGYTATNPATESFTYTVVDRDGDTSSAQLSVKAILPPLPPAATADSYSVNEDGTLTVSTVNGVLRNDTDPNGDVLKAVLVGGPANGSLTFNPDGSFSYTPKADFNGTDSFTYKANDGGKDSAAVTVTINVVAVNDAPQGVDKAIGLTEDGSHVLAVADFGFADAKDTPANTLANVIVQSPPTNGLLLLNGAPVLAGTSISLADINAGKLIFKPDAGEAGNGYASFTFKVQDNGGTANGGADTSSEVKTITFNVAENIAPVLDIDANNSSNTHNLRDEFSSISNFGNAANGSDGSVNWASTWVETDNSNNAIHVDSGKLTFDYDIRGGESIQRAISLTGATPATLTFDYDVDLESGETVSVQAYKGTQWVTLQTITGNTTTSFSVNLLPSYTAIKFVANGDWETGDFFTVDNVNIAYTTASGFDYLTSFTENGNGVSIADTDTTVNDADGIGDIRQAVISLTNAKVGDDLFVLGNLPGGLTHRIETDVSGKINLVITGNGTQTKAQWETAIEAVRFRSTSENPNTDDRIVQSWLNDGSDNSSVQTTRIKVTAVNDPVTARNDNITVNLVASDAATISIPLLALLWNDTDLDGDASITSVRSLSSLEAANVGDENIVLTNGTGSWSGWIWPTYTPDTNWGSFNYRLSDGTLSSQASVDVSHGALNGTSQADILINAANVNNLTINGGNGNDVLVGGSSINILNGGAGDDLLIGGNGNDTLNGGDNNDVLIGGAGADILTGGNGDDILIGGLGQDTLTGGAGADTFVFSEAGSANRDIITDFVVGLDEIDLSDLFNDGVVTQGNVNSYVRIDDQGANAILQVSQNGNGNWTDVAILNGHGATSEHFDIKIDDIDFNLKIV